MYLQHTITPPALIPKHVLYHCIVFNGYYCFASSSHCFFIHTIAQIACITVEMTSEDGDTNKRPNEALAYRLHDIAG
jgi:hypothetical protein